VRRCYFFGDLAPAKRLSAEWARLTLVKIRTDIYIFRLHQFGKLWEYGAILRKDFYQCIQRFVVLSPRLKRVIASGISISFYCRNVMAQRREPRCQILSSGSFWNLDRAASLTRHMQNAIKHLSCPQSFINWMRNFVLNRLRWGISLNLLNTESPSKPVASAFDRTVCATVGRVSDIQGVPSASVPRLRLKRFSCKTFCRKVGKYYILQFDMVEVQLDVRSK
jgi:hypothetical protein